MAPLVTTAGKGIITNRLRSAGTEPNFTAWGTGVTAEAVAQTALVTPSAEARVAGASTQQTTTVANDTYQVVTTLTSASGQAITEVGLFDAVTVGNMFMRAVFAAINLVSGDSITFTIKVQFS